MKKKWYQTLIARLIIALILGIGIGLVANEAVMQVIGSIKTFLGQLIMYCIPLVILGFIAPAIISLNENAGKMLSVTLAICYLSSVGAALFSMVSGYLIIPHLSISTEMEGLREMPDLLFNLEVAPIMPVMTALVTAVLIGLAVIWTKAETVAKLFEEFNRIVLAIVEKFVILILPFFIAGTFAVLAYEGGIIHQLPIFLQIILLVILGHYIWMTLLYSIAGSISKTNPLEVVRHYGPAYVTALGTMSSAATLPVALRCASKAKTLDAKVRDFVIPLCSNCHLCGSVLTETFFVMTVSQLLYGHMPAMGTMILFSCLLGIFAIAAPGVPGGTVMASLGLITGVLGFDDAGVALMLSIFALQDSFGTACNITGDGAIALMVTGIFKKVPGRVK
uniref:dicarboxylate/amino acid:cation symporter n=1 Tax=Ndongobacter massiliensis TaxID=1871025 RepID=UPI00093083E7|nr:dicarboxylate/amino acid:cation symporter [Ndongobacter massiliensis]